LLALSPPVTASTIARIAARIGSVPYGYDLGADGATLTENAEEQRIVADIRQMRGRRMKLREIASELTGRGIRTKTGKSRWSHQSIARIFARRAT
jgi:hypothetical protein